MLPYLVYFKDVKLWHERLMDGGKSCREIGKAADKAIYFYSE